MQMWLWTLNHLQTATDPDGAQALSRPAPGRDLRHWPMRSAGCSPRAARSSTSSNSSRAASPTHRSPRALAGTVQFLSDLCHTQAAQAAGEVSRICAELVFGYNQHPAWDENGCRACFTAIELDDFEVTMPGISAMAVDVASPNGTHAPKAGPCAGCAGAADFLRLQNKLSICLSGSRLAKDRAAETVSTVMIPEALDYPS